MKLTVHRVNLDAAGSTTVELPHGAEVIQVAWKRGEYRPSLWYSFRDTHSTAFNKRRRFLLVGTGDPVDDTGEATHVGSFIAPDGFHVFHVFEVSP